ncbi:hypothetical protein ebA603 [Aromatoleum aromaticum EbN1]|uniref:Uncharacterized protein n=1 Tax=Aromatoleum aromaticum (strain DSM 19018 / LMG 30748 / EbN1) TaxID=76114 RepID=Q5P8C4_AROAE|nr:hypothetical protein ebA603 [Aromatoleum aromaticum EbN1]
MQEAPSVVFGSARLGLRAAGLCPTVRGWGPQAGVIGRRRFVDVGRSFASAGFSGELLPAFFFLPAFLRQIPLALFELVIWFCQEIPFGSAKPIETRWTRARDRASLRRLCHNRPACARPYGFHTVSAAVPAA